MHTIITQEDWELIEEYLNAKIVYVVDVELKGDSYGSNYRRLCDAEIALQERFVKDEEAKGCTP